ncbi:PIG-L deacetylase family protein [Fodinibius sp. SL11]|uniref:PIG-L deacetylase family protein n=1 Tax=Fodinibius sp. SL11 TaxID=3425690 RepID=UPI003F885EE8
MISAKFSTPNKEGLKMLFLGAHCDDIEIGCGGTVLHMIENYKIDHIKWVVFTSNEVRKKEAESSAKEFLKSVKNADVDVYDYQDGFLPSVWSEIKVRFEDLKKEIEPDIIFTHYRNDLHQDHRTLNELTWNTFRNHLIFEYEIPKYDGDIGNPNLFVPLNEDQIKQRNEIITSCFKSQQNKQWLDDSLLTSMPRIRGIECASKGKYAEAFYSRKLTI